MASRERWLMNCLLRWNTLSKNFSNVDRIWLRKVIKLMLDWFSTIIPADKLRASFGPARYFDAKGIRHSFATVCLSEQEFIKGWLEARELEGSLPANSSRAAISRPRRRRDASRLQPSARGGC